MDTWVAQIHRRAQIVIDQIMAARTAATLSGVDLEGLEAQYRLLLERLYTEEMPSARLRDNSDLIVRAEGPGADHQAPELHSFSWLSEHVRVQLGKLTAAVLPMAVRDAKAAAKRLHWAFMGYAPGSIMLGFSLRHPESMPGFEETDRAAYAMLSASAQSIATVPQFVGNTELDAAIQTAIPDPALRDSAVTAARHLAPTLQSGIHTIEVASRNGDYGTLSQRERMVLKNAVDRPDLRQMRSGTFVGSLRAADLDKRRAVLRDVDGLGSAIRCIIDENTEANAKALFGARVKVEGDYETDAEGRPRLMRIRRLSQDTSQPPLI